MKSTQYVFKRKEKKYLLSEEQYHELSRRLAPYTMQDAYGQYTICNLYCDTEDFQIIRTSIEKPVYKEKLRIRSYGTPGADDTVFLEIKKKFNGVVYKRRVELTEREALDCFVSERERSETQIWREISWFMKNARPVPKVFLAYERTALGAVEDWDIRITFDRNIRWRTDELALSLGDYGERLLPDGTILMEIKLPYAAPLWLAGILSGMRLYPVSFSKYGECYKRNILGRLFASPEAQPSHIA